MKWKGRGRKEKKKGRKEKFVKQGTSCATKAILVQHKMYRKGCKPEAIEKTKQNKLATLRKDEKKKKTFVA